MKKLTILILILFSNVYAGCMNGGNCICTTGKCAAALYYFEMAINHFDNAVENKTILGDNYNPRESIRLADNALKESCALELTTQDKKQLDYEFRQMGVRLFSF